MIAEQALAGLTSLALLDLSRNNLHTMGPTSLQPLVSLQVLRITGEPGAPTSPRFLFWTFWTLTWACVFCCRQPVALRLRSPLAEELDRRGGPAAAQLGRAAAGVHRAPAPLPPQPGGGPAQQPGVHPPPGAAGAQEAGSASGREPQGVVPCFWLPSASGQDTDLSHKLYF